MTNPRGSATPLELDIERTVAGGRSLARHDGQVVLVSGAIAGERVVAEVERTQRGVVFARTVKVLRADPARRDPGPDPACGGMTLSHVSPERQRELKTEIVTDAFARIAKMRLSAPVPVHASPEAAYRMRARVHLRDGRIGSFREGTHEVCPVALTRQVSEACADVVERVGQCLRAHGMTRLESIEIAENLDGRQRVVHLEQGKGETLPAQLLGELAMLEGMTGLSVADAWATKIGSVSGVPWVSDPVSAYAGTDGVAPGLAAAPLRRHARAFFQANRYLAATLVASVLSRLDDGPVVDLYAGVGLFAVAAAARGRDAVTAIEGDPVSAADLAANAAPFAPHLRVTHASVERALADGRGWHEATAIVDPPRTGMSREAVDGLLASRPRRIVYVSCDVATLARDARRFVDAGYEMGHVEAFDLFPNTPHVEGLTDFRLA